MERVRLTVQLRDAGNHMRVTEHVDVPLNQVSVTAAAIGKRITGYYRKGRKNTGDEQE